MDQQNVQTAEAASAQTASEGGRERIRNGSWLDAQVFPPLLYAVPGLVPEGLTLLVGAPKMGKSWAALDICLAVASGGFAFGAIQVPDSRPVFLLALEDSWRRLQSRSKTLLCGEAIPPLLQMSVAIDATDPLAKPREWLARYGEARPLVVIDTYGKLADNQRAGEGVYARDYRVTGAIKALADEHPGTAIVALHHDRKAGYGDFVESVSGSNGIAGAADTIMVLKRDRLESGAVLQVTGRDVHEDAYALDFNKGSWTLCGKSLKAAAAEAKRRSEGGDLGQRSGEILRFVNDRPLGVTPAEVAAELGIDNKIAGNALGQLAKGGRVARPSRGKYGPLDADASESSESDESSTGLATVHYIHDFHQPHPDRD